MRKAENFENKMFPRFSTTTIMTAILVALSLLTVAAAVPASNRSLGPRIRAPSSNSTNWSGFAVTAGPGAVSDAKGSWIVPAIQGSCASTNQYSSFWVGIDGFNSGTVEQTLTVRTVLLHTTHGTNSIRTQAFSSAGLQYILATTFPLR